MEMGKIELRWVMDEKPDPDQLVPIRYYNPDKL
jgi:hypothetical protein